LTTGVTKLDEDDYKKFTWVIRYLMRTMSMTVNMSTISTKVVQWWIVASFAVHSNMRSHMGGIMMQGHEVVYASSTRQKINLKSSTI